MRSDSVIPATREAEAGESLGDFFRGIGYNHPCIRKMHIWIGIEVVITALTRNARWLWPFSPLKTLDL